MDDWGELLGRDLDLTLPEKAEIVTAFFEGYKRQDQAFGYARAFRGLISQLPDGLRSLEAHMPFDLVLEIKQSKFYEYAQISKEEFEKNLSDRLLKFSSPLVDYHF